MTPETALIAAAIIGAGASIIVGLIQMTSSIRNMADKNAEDHSAVRERLMHLKDDIHEIKDGVKSVNERLNEHVSWHLDHHNSEKQT